jgi:TonB family protein
MADPLLCRALGLGRALALTSALTVVTVQVASGQSLPPEPITEWHVATERARVNTEDGVIKVAGRPRGWVRSRRGVSDLILRLEFRVMTRETSGALLVRAWTDETNTFARAGYRVALRGQNSRDELLGQIKGLSERVKPTMAPLAEPPLTLGEWQHLEVHCIGDEVRVLLNGALIHTVTGSERSAGQIGLEITNGAIEMRNVWLTPVSVELPEGITWTTRLPDNAVMPRLRREVQPRYTADAQERGIEGTVEIEGVVGIDGRIGPARIVRSLIPDLDAEAIAALRHWQFEPAIVDGKPVPCVVTVVQSFRLQ